MEHRPGETVIGRICENIDPGTHTSVEFTETSTRGSTHRPNSWKHRPGDPHIGRIHGIIEPGIHTSTEFAKTSTREPAHRTNS
ncbi:hypothetical protein WMZ97_09480 [Lentibacillus sp. N15]